MFFNTYIEFVARIFIKAPTVSDEQDSEGDGLESDEEPTYATYTRTETETVANDIIEETDSYGNITKSAQGFVT